MCDNELSPTPNPGLARELEDLKCFLNDTNWSVAEYGTISNWVSATSVWLVDASLLHDSVNLSAALEMLRNHHMHAKFRGDPERLIDSIAALAEVARAALDRARQHQL